MKHSSKFLSLFLVVVMLFSMTSTAYAASTPLNEAENIVASSTRTVPNKATGNYSEKATFSFIVEADVKLTTTKVSPTFKVKLSGNSGTTYTVIITTPIGSTYTKVIEANGSSFTKSFAYSGIYFIQITPYNGSVGSNTVTATVTTS